MVDHLGEHLRRLSEEVVSGIQRDYSALAETMDNIRRLNKELHVERSKRSEMNLSLKAIASKYGVSLPTVIRVGRRGMESTASDPLVHAIDESFAPGDIEEYL